MIKQGQFKGKTYLYESYGFEGIPDSYPKPLVFIGGAFQSIKSISTITQGLLKYGPVIVLDLPGFGDSESLNASYSFEFYCELLDDFFSIHQINDIGLIGASYGSAIAYLYAYGSSRVSSLTLAGTMKAIPDYQRDNILRSIHELESGDVSAFADTAINVLMNHSKRELINRYADVRQMLHRAMKRLAPADQLKYIQNTERLLNMQLDLTKAPTCNALVFTGEFDAFTMPAYCLEICRSMRHSQMRVVCKADHMFHVEQLPTTLQLFAWPHVQSGPLSEVDNQRAYTGENQERVNEHEQQFA